MLTSYPKSSAEHDASAATWLDLVDPTDQEQRQAAALLGTQLPTRRQVADIALSSRVRASEEILRINIPGFVRADGGQGVLTPLGVLLTPKLLVTLRYAESIAFERLATGVAANAAGESSIETFVGLFESVAETAADRMQVLSGELSQLSRDVFSDRPGHSQMLRGVLFQVGRIQRQLSQIRTAQLGVQRGLAHLCDGAPKWIERAHIARLQVVLTDLHAMSEFDQQMDDKVQFLLDATLGFINNDQNDLIKVLTIASVVTIPPMILAGIWGMNFKSIPEYNWANGYGFAWAMIVLSMLLPLAWFKWKKWF
ncbi:MAG TPA: CorA family divalent cation transporter [Rudaea sp.]|jgi:magnesium transporter|nr:CorA family divalent cation transporter [Rudaea sp.]